MNSSPKKILWLYLLLVLLPAGMRGQEVAHRVFLTGNLTDLDPESDFYTELGNQLTDTQEPFTLILNGDLKPAGSSAVPAPLRSLLLQVNATPNGRVLLIPGDRDWANSGESGYQEVLKFQQAIETLQLAKVYWALPDACPGPQLIPLDDHIVLLALNTQWWNHPYNKPQPDDAKCKIISTADAMEEIAHLVEENQQKNIVIAGHYPVVSYGNYGGYFSSEQHLIPSPLIGGFRTGYRAHVGSPRDLSNPNFQPFAEGIQSLFYDHQGLIYVSAHEKNQQVIRSRDDWYLNSGAPEAGGYAASGEGATLCNSQPGILRLDFFEDASVSTTQLAKVPGGGFQEYATVDLYQPLCTFKPSRKATPISRAAEYCAPESLWVQAGVPIPEEPIVRKAGPEYTRGKMARLFLGANWREAWNTPVTTHYLRIDTAYDGLFLYEKGGGRETISLNLRANDGTRFVFRSVNKKPERTLDYSLRNTLVRRVAKDITSTQHPYGALVVDPLLDRLDILHAHPHLAVLPDVPQLGIYQGKYGDLFGMLEEKPGKPNDKGVHFGNAEQILQTNQMFRTLYQSPEYEVDQAQFIRARLLDMWVGDWGRKEANWTWAAYRKEETIRYQPIPRNRDRAFTRLNGLLYWLADREWAVDKIQDFDRELEGIRSLNGQAAHLDRLLTNESTAEDWSREATFIQEQISSQTIEAAINNMPPEIVELNGKELREKLNSRKAALKTFAKEYYALLAREVEVTGTGQHDYFEVTRQENGSVRVEVFEMPDGPGTQTPWYARTFLPEETREVRLYGLGGDDHFHLHGNTDSSIRIRIISGGGEDQIIDESRVKGPTHYTRIYDQDEATLITDSGETRQVHHWNPDLYHYQYDRFRYNSYLPLLAFGYDQFNGLQAGASIQFTHRKWDRQDYAGKHKLVATVSSAGNKSVSYTGRFHQLFRQWDLELAAAIRAPEYHNRFFGVGNETTIDRERFDNTDYYVLEYNRISGNLGVVRDFWQRSTFRTGVSLERNAVQNDTSRSILGLDPDLLGIVEPLTQIGPYADVDIDLRDRQGLPTKGVRAFLSYDHNFQLRHTDTHYGLAQGFLEYYATLRVKMPLTLGLRVGGAKSVGTVPFYQMVALGSDRNLRGYNTHRFTGNDLVYLNSEVRWELVSKQESLIPFQLGLKGFLDVGRVFANGESSQRWHAGYGGGLYVAPFSDRLLLSVSLGFSEEESFFPLIGIGTSFR